MELAAQRLSALVAAERTEAEVSRKEGVHDLHGKLQRCEPRRIFEGERFRKIT